MNKQGHEDADIIGFIVEHRDEHGYPPTVTEMAERFGLARATVHWHLQRMAREGKLERVVAGGIASARAIKITEQGMKLISSPLEQF